MSLPSLSEAGGWLLSAADTVLPDDRIAACATGAAAVALLVGGGWRVSNPARDNAPVPRLSPKKRQAPPMPDDAVHGLLDVPLDVIPTDANGSTPYDVVGPDAIASAVDRFYSQMLADADLAPLFAGVNMKRLKRHQALFLGQLWGGPVQYPLHTLEGVHARLDITPERYWRVVGHLMVTLTHLRVPDWVCVFTATRLYQARDLVIGERYRTGSVVVEPAEDVAEPAAK